MKWITILCIPALLGSTAVAAEWLTKREVHSSRSRSFDRLSVVDDGAGGFWYRGGSRQENGNESYTVHGRVAGTAELTEPLLVTESALLPLGSDRLLVKGFDLTVLDGNGDTVARVRAPANCLQTIKVTGGQIWALCESELYRYDQSLSLLDRRSIADAGEYVQALRTNMDGRVVAASYRIEQQQSCYTLLGSNGSRLWQYCESNHRIPDLIVGSRLVYVRSGTASSVGLARITVLDLRTGALVATENYRDRSDSAEIAPRLMGDGIALQRLASDEISREIAYFDVAGRWRSICAGGCNQLLRFEVTGPESLVAATRSFDPETRSSGVRLSGHMLARGTSWQRDFPDTTLSELRPARGGDVIVVLRSGALSNAPVHAQRFDGDGEPASELLDSYLEPSYLVPQVIDANNRRLWNSRTDPDGRTSLSGLGFEPESDSTVLLAGRGLPPPYTSRLKMAGSWACQITADLACADSSGADGFVLPLFGDDPPHTFGELDLDQDSNGDLRLATVRDGRFGLAKLGADGSLVSLASTLFPSTIRAFSGYSASRGMVLGESIGILIAPLHLLFGLDPLGEPNPEHLTRVGRILAAVPMDEGDVLFADASLLSRVKAGGEVRWHVAMPPDSALLQTEQQLAVSTVIVVNSPEGAIGLSTETGELLWRREMIRPMLGLEPVVRIQNSDEALGPVLWSVAAAGPVMILERLRLRDGSRDLRFALPCAIWRCAIGAADISTDGDLLVSLRDRLTNVPALTLASLQLNDLEAGTGSSSKAVLDLADSQRSDQGVVMERSPEDRLGSGFWYGFVADSAGLRRPAWRELQPRNGLAGADGDSFSISAISPREIVEEIGTAAIAMTSDAELVMRQTFALAGAFGTREVTTQIKHFESVHSSSARTTLWVPSAMRAPGWVHISSDGNGVWGLPSGRWLRLSRIRADEWALLLEMGGEPDDVPRSNVPGKQVRQVGRAQLTGGCASPIWRFRVNNEAEYPELRKLNGALSLRAAGGCP